MNLDSEFIIANYLFVHSPREGERDKVDNDRRREMWLKEIKDAIRYEQAYLRVKVKDKQFD